MKKEIILNVKEPSELLKLMYAEIKGVPKGKIKSFLEHRQVSVNGIVTTKFNHPVKSGDTVKISTGEGTRETRGIKIVYEDEWIVAVNKPSGLLTVATDREKEKTAYALLSENRRGKLFVVHRLDRDTSGVLLFAKSYEIKEALQEDWNDRILLREYLAVCEGSFESKKGVCKSFIAENSAHIMYSAREGKLAITEYEVLRENAEYSYVKLNLRTGRKNQIRVHMKELGNPVVGDKKYGSTKNPIGRLGLHAVRLGFIHPVSGEELIVKAEPERKFTLPKK
ncbi:MAG: RluA family pseudouridine synthase [Oscillospiraceae bacterium]|nr:RluA family pseudouridine synthase [Oscillospiraceae bacterium]